MSKTLLQLKAYARAGVLELNDKTWANLILVEDINRSVQKVWRDIRPLAIKSLKKEATLAGSIFLPPSDLSEDPNSIQSVVASDVGTRGSVTLSYTVPTADLTFTAKEPGTTGIVVATTVGASTGTIIVSCVYSTSWTITIYMQDNDLTCNQILALINADPVAGNLVTVSTTTGSTKPAPGRTVTGTLSAGTGASYYPAKEWNEEEYYRLATDPYRAASTTDPRWCLTANSGGQRIIKMSPNTVTFTKMIYYYFPALLVNDTDVCPIPEEFEELLLIEIIRKGFNRLGDANKEAIQINEYDKKSKELFEKYGAGLVNQKAEADRMKSDD